MAIHYGFRNELPEICYRSKIKERVTMASIVKRKKKYSVVYTYVDESGKKKERIKLSTNRKRAASLFRLPKR